LNVSSVPTSLAQLYNYAWFIGFGVAFASYLIGRRIFPRG